MIGRQWGWSVHIQAAGHVDVAVRKLSRQGNDPRASNSQMTSMAHQHCIKHRRPADTAGSNKQLLPSELWA